MRLGLVVIFVAMVLLFLVVGLSRGRGQVRPEYVRRELLTSREFEFFRRLRAALPDAVIHVQVAMSALVDVKGAGRAGRNRFDRKVFDFVVCTEAGRVLYVVELDDRSHASASARRRDRVKDEIAEAVGLRVIRYRSVNTDVDVFRRDFRAVVDLVAYRGV